MSSVRICFVVSSAMTVEAFLIDQIRALSEQYEVHLAVNADQDSMQDRRLANVKVHRIRIERPISLLADFAAVLQLVRHFRQNGYAAVHSVTPKAGLLTAIAAWVARVPIRV